MMNVPLVSVVLSAAAVSLVSLVLLVDAVVGQVHVSVAEVLRCIRVPADYPAITHSATMHR